MKVRDVFIGRARHWLVLVAVVAGLAALGSTSAHVRHFVPFVLGVLAIGVACVAAVLVGHRPDLRVTREPLDESGE